MIPPYNFHTKIHDIHPLENQGTLFLYVRYFGPMSMQYQYVGFVRFPSYQSLKQNLILSGTIVNCGVI